MRTVNISLQANGKEVIVSMDYQLDKEAQRKLDMCDNKEQFLIDMDEYMIKSFTNGLQKELDKRIQLYNENVN